MYQYIWDMETGGLQLVSEELKFSKEPRPVYYRELDVLGFDKYWKYPKDDAAPIMWAEANNYIYRGRVVAKAVGGAIYSPPQIEILDDPEPNGQPLIPVDIDAMIKKNADLMETFVQETILKIYNTYRKYKKKVDVFYVAFSGGKDSIVTLDLVQRALPHNSFVVLFGDTRMEFSDTYDTVDRVKSQCESKGISFYTSRSEFTPEETWSKFGPPSTVLRWCCSVHKTAPQILLLRKLLNKPNFTGMAFVGVRADESLSRSKYDYVSFGEKHRGQYSCNAILNWSSAEVFLYIFANKLVLNEAYKKGNRRAGCLVCPRAAERNDFMNHYCYSKEAEPFVNSIRNAYSNHFQSPEDLEQFIEVGGWKARKNGRDISIPINYKEQVDATKRVIISVDHPRTNWKEWIKTIGILANETSPYVIRFRESLLRFDVVEEEEKIEVFVDEQVAHDNPEFVKHLKNVFRKAACCIACRECQADCPYGCLNFEDGQVQISENCHHCSQCHKADKGCLVYKSLEMPKRGIIMAGKKKSLNSYSHHAPKMDWINQYFTYKNKFNEEHKLGKDMFSFFKRFLRDAKLLDATGFSKTAEIIESIGLESEESWAIILINLCYAPQVQWYVTKVDFNREYSKKLLASMMVDDGAKESWTNDIFSSLVRMSELPLGKVGIGEVTREKNKAVGLTRNVWQEPSALVILYSLYRFAEACGEYYQFTLDSLFDDSTEKEGVSPVRIFGIDRENMVRILNGLSVNYPEYISVSFTLDLDNITLRSEKTSTDVLQLF